MMSEVEHVGIRKFILNDRRSWDVNGKRKNSDR